MAVVVSQYVCVEMVVKTKENGCCCDVDPHVRISRGKVLTRCAKWAG